MSNVSFDARGTDRALGPASYRDEDFPGCESFHLPASEIDDYDGRLEFWDGYTETAWKIPETPIQHEGPSRQLVQMSARCAMLRGSPISNFGSSDLVRLDAAGRKRWLMQADETLYLHREVCSRLRGPAIDVDADPLPDLVLEVDHTTDVRRRKLGIYKEGGFAEIWVLVPWESSVRVPGLTIHVRHGEEYREEAASRAFPGWKAQEIHRALTDAPMSETAWRALERTALAMGAREGTTPQHDPLMASESARVRARSHAQGHREGRVQGHREGQAEGRAEGRAQGRAEAHAQGHMDAVADVLASRGIELTLDMTKHRELCSAIPGTVVVAAALACTSEADFRRRIREQLDPGAELRR